MLRCQPAGDAASCIWQPRMAYADATPAGTSTDAASSIATPASADATSIATAGASTAAACSASTASGQPAAIADAASAATGDAAAIVVAARRATFHAEPSAADAFAPGGWHRVLVWRQRRVAQHDPVAERRSI